MRKLIYMTGLLAATVASVFLCLQHSKRTESEVRELTIHLLKTVPKAFLVLETDEQVALPIVDNGNWLFGPRRGQASIRIRSHWGCDLQTITPDDVEVAGSKVRIRLPAPALFDTAADISSWCFTGRRSGFQFIGDIMAGRSLESELLQIVHSFQPQASPNAIEARRQTFVDRMNRTAAEMFSAKGLTVQFR